MASLEGASYRNPRIFQALPVDYLSITWHWVLEKMY